MVMVEVSKSPVAELKTDGAETESTLKTIADAESFEKTPTIKSSMPFRFPWLSSSGTIEMMLKLAKGAIDE